MDRRICPTAAGLPSVDCMNDELPAAVDLRGGSFRYGQIRAVDGLTLTIRPGEVVALLGPNGAGKSTTINLMLDVLKPDTGTVRIGGLAPAQAIKQGRIGAMPQEGGLVPRTTVAELIRFLHGLYPDPMPVAEVLAIAGLTDLAGRTVERLSGGQAQRLRF